jgi:hypothetical protein
MAMFSGFEFLQEIEDISVINNLKLIGKIRTYEIYTNGYIYLFDTIKQRLFAIKSTKNISDSGVMEELIKTYEFVYNGIK